MAATRPRRSLLELFDPLEERDASSPDSDKENTFDATSLFGQPTTKEHSSPVKLSRRLIDVGDITTDDPSLLCMLTDEDELEEVGEEDEKDPTINLQNLTPVRDNVKNPQFLSSISIIRTPLRELQTEQESAPVSLKAPKRSLLPSSPLALAASTSALPTISETTGISSIIDRVNTSGTCFASPSRVQEVHLDDGPKEGPKEDCDRTPEAMAFPESTPPCETIPEEPLEISLSDVTHFESTPATDARLPASNLRPPKTDSSPYDINRQSTDLQTSFQLHMQSEEASFDLLKDKISFFNSPGNDDNDTFDMTTEMEKMKQIIAEAGLEEPSTDGTGGKDSTVETSPVTARARVFSPKTPSNVSRSTQPERRAEEAIHNAPAKATSHISIPKAAVFIPPPAIEQPQVAVSQSQSTRPSIPAPSRRSSLAMRGSAVPALRIIKRAPFQGHEKSASSTSIMDPVVSSTPSVTPVAHTAQAPVTGTSIEKPLPSRLQRRVSVGLIATTKPGTTTSTTGVRRLTVADRGRASVNPPTIQELGKSTAGPRRAPIAQGSSAATLMKNDRGSLSKSTTTGPRRVPISAPSVNPTTEALAPIARRTADALGGLKAPVRQARPSVTGSSAVPRPSLSRLPAPGASGIARPSLGSAGRVGGTAMSGRNPITRRTVQ